MIFGYKIDESISLKILEQREAPLLFKLVDSNREYLSEFLPFVEYTTTVEDSKKFIRSALQQFSDGNGFHSGIWFYGELVGVIGLHYLDLVNKKTSIGYYLAETFQKKGIMTKCTEALIRYIYEEFDVNRIEICMSTDNKKSQSIPQRLGFTKEGTLRSNERLHGKFSDSYVYSLLREEYDHSLSLNN
ncbi:GNAT family N-acetyltransferase [Staphylococcus lugdunensis]|uniref:Acetyltransferase, GNAT family n=1 Tax=Staphylococcus lugdunensis TaxID=28035 RepID=A0ABD4EGF8_STALU|nr:acetyltransferase, GNAT family [Staphylococcus lugdunensis M23590]KXA38841.1 acetyltransferase, GNAT family [Staphylococcus lugdunensis]SQE72753.1 ribosomal-protein-L7p-serine acetyltransferase [Staphylococcus lugdunensis]